jgi:ACS family glucarate transporter-like MFS transporter
MNVILLSLSYMSEGYLLFMFVSWLYIYLVEVRGFSLARGGLVATLPWIAAIVATPLGGILSDRLTVRFGRVRSAQVLIMTGYTLSGLLLLVAAQAHNRLSAVFALCVSLGSLYLAESSFWTTATAIAGKRAGDRDRVHEYYRHAWRYRLQRRGASAAKNLWSPRVDRGVRIGHRNGTFLCDSLVDPR